MAFKEHPEFQPPVIETATIWRYMDLAKFLSLLDRSELFFVRVDKLANIDPFEGYYTALNVLADNLKFEDLPQDWRERTNIRDERTFRFMVESNRLTRETVKGQRELTFVSSWHVQEHESAAMWSLYVKSQEGIAVQSTYGMLIRSLANYNDFEVHIGMVRYIDYQREGIPLGNLLSPFMYKRKSFEHEKELRALIWTPQHGKNAMDDPSRNKYRDQSGIRVPIDLSKLISRVYVAPTAPPWTVDLLASIVNKYGFKIPVVQSDLASTPVY